MKNIIWNALMEQLIEENFENYKKTREHQRWTIRMEHIDEMLTTNLAEDEKHMVEDVLFEIGEQQEHYADILYQQGMKDCVCILKNLGVL